MSFALQKKKSKSPTKPNKQNHFSFNSHTPHNIQTMSNQEIQRLIKSGTIQASLKISHPNDPYEREADKVAATVMGMSENQDAVNFKRHDNTISRQEEEMIQTKQDDAISRKCTSCQMNNNEDNVEISRKPSSHDNSEVSGNFVQQLDNSGSGKTLDNSTKQFMESRIGYDFGNVRIHDDSKANGLARAVNARAFTRGSDIFLGRNESISDKRLMAHELTHVVQNDDVVHRYDIGPPVHEDWGLSEEAVARNDPNRPIEVSVIDDSDLIGWIAGLTRIGEVYMTNVQTMVDNVLTEIGQRNMSRLNILDHGNENRIQIGNDRITPANVGIYTPNLQRLQGHFSANGFVHLQHCDIGQNQALICALAAAFGVPVYAGTGKEKMLFRFNTGDYVRCDPNGTFDPDVGRP